MAVKYLPDGQDFSHAHFGREFGFSGSARQPRGYQVGGQVMPGPAPADAGPMPGPAPMPGAGPSMQSPLARATVTMPVQDAAQGAAGMFQAGRKQAIGNVAAGMRAKRNAARGMMTGAATAIPAQPPQSVTPMGRVPGLKKGGKVKRFAVGGGAGEDVAGDLASTRGPELAGGTAGAGGPGGTTVGDLSGAFGGGFNPGALAQTALGVLGSLGGTAIGALAGPLGAIGGGIVGNLGGKALGNSMGVNPSGAGVFGGTSQVNPNQSTGVAQVQGDMPAGIGGDNFGGNLAGGFGDDPAEGHGVGYMAKGGHAKKAFNPGGSKGKLHHELGIPESEKIGASRLSAAAHSSNPEVKRDAIRAQTMKKWHHGKKK